MGQGLGALLFNAVICERATKQRPRDNASDRKGLTAEFPLCPVHEYKSKLPREFTHL